MKVEKIERLNEALKLLKDKKGGDSIEAIILEQYQDLKALDMVHKRAVYFNKLGE